MIETILIVTAVVWLFLCGIALALIEQRKDSKKIQEDLREMIFKSTQKTIVHAAMSIFFLYLVLPLSIVFSLYHIISWRKK